MTNAEKAAEVEWALAHKQKPKTVHYAMTQREAEAKAKTTPRWVFYLGKSTFTPCMSATAPVLSRNRGKVTCWRCLDWLARGKALGRLHG